MRSDATNRVLRSCLQLVAGGGLAALVAALADGVGPVAAATLALFNTLVVTTAQNWLEEAGYVKPLLKPKPAGELVDAAGTVVGQVVGATVGEVAAVAGTIIDDSTSEVLGAVGEKDEEGGE